MSWLTIVQNIVNFISGGFGSALVVIAIGIAGARAALHGHWGHFWSAIGGGAVLLSAAWVVATFMGGGG
jgi:type IV secretory pathway VirB2 component (pilin)